MSNQQKGWSMHKISHFAHLFKYPSGSNDWSISVSTINIKLTIGPVHTNWREISIGKWLSTMQRSRQVIILSSQLPKIIQTHLLSQSSNSIAFETIKILNYSNRIKTIIFSIFLKGTNFYFWDFKLLLVKFLAMLNPVDLITL